MASGFKPCSIEGCKGNAHYSAKGARGWCRRHYRLWQSRGEPVPLKAANGEPMGYLKGFVLQNRGGECLLWPYARTSNGYAWVYNPEGSKLVSRILCEEVHGPPPSDVHEAAHSCGNGHMGCVTREHIRWASPLENAADRQGHGTQCRGEAIGTSKLTAEQVREIRQLQGSLPIDEIASRFGVTPASISHIHTGHTWSWLDA